MTNTAPMWDRPADQLRAQAEQAYERIRSNGSLNETARQALIAAVFVDLRDRMAALQQQTGVTTASEQAALKRAVFGIDDVLGASAPATQATVSISFRDATDRASKITAEAEALRMLDAAETAGDETMAQAIFNAFTQSGFAQSQEVADRFLSARPAKAAAFTKLMQSGRPADARTMFEWITPLPHELASLPLGTSVETLAAQAGQIRAAAAATVAATPPR